MDIVFQSNKNFVSAATESGFFKEVDNNLHRACMLISKKAAPRANKDRHKRNCLRLKRYWNTYKNEIQQKYVSTIT